MAGYLFALLAGIALLLISADWFVEGAVAVARHGRVPPLLIGMVIVGFGTSFPEILVSVLASMQGSSGIALGNAYGSNIANIGLILGISALVKPMIVHSGVLRRELPILVFVTLLSWLFLWDKILRSWEAIVLLLLFVGLILWMLRQARSHPWDALAEETAVVSDAGLLTMRQGLIRLVFGLLVLIASSRLLVWSASAVARLLGLGDMIIGLTVVAVGTSLPEFAASIAAVRKGEYDIAIGNVLGSNLINTLAAIGLSGVIRPIVAEPAMLFRDLPVMTVLTLSLFLFGYRFRSHEGQINRVEGGLLVAGYIGYLLWLMLPFLQNG